MKTLVGNPDVHAILDVRPRRTHLGVVLDRSGSMAAVREATIAGFNEWLNTQQRATSEDVATVFTLLFDDEFLVLHDAEPVAGVAPLTPEQYVPRGQTALNDAVAHTIRALERVQRPGDRVLLTVMTDGQENASKYYSNARLKALIQTKEQSGSWTVAYIGASLNLDDRQRLVQDYGLQFGNTVGYAASPLGTARAFHAFAVATQQARQATATSTSNLFQGQDDLSS